MSKEYQEMTDEEIIQRATEGTKKVLDILGNFTEIEAWSCNHCGKEIISNDIELLDDHLSNCDVFKEQNGT